jgi:archaellum biogenesis protein FlaJ (TadC family)
MSRKINRDTVFQSLNNAIDNGYELEDWTEREIAENLHEYDAQFEGVDPNLLIPIVKDWYNQKYR